MSIRKPNIISSIHIVILENYESKRLITKERTLIGVRRERPGRKYVSGSKKDSTVLNGDMGFDSRKQSSKIYKTKKRLPAHTLSS